jgi:hypothetical protein
MISETILRQLKSVPGFAHYFRYPLHKTDFQDLRRDGRLLGRFASKGLYGKLDQHGKVDQSAGLDGQVATIFVPARARTARSASVLLSRTKKESLVHPDGRKNWRNIYRAGRLAVLSQAGRPPKRREDLAAGRDEGRHHG